jgi:hypothetical protein
MSGLMSMTKSCSFLGGAVGAAGTLYLKGAGMSGKSALMVALGGAVGYGGRMLNDQVLGTPGVSTGPIPSDPISCSLFGVLLGGLTVWVGSKYA